MSNPTLAEFFAYEANWEPVVQALLKAAGQPVMSPFLAPTELKQAPDDACFVTYEPGQTSDDVRVFRPDVTLEGGLASEHAGFFGTIVVTRRVPVGDLPTVVGETPGCYAKLCTELGAIRALLLDTARPFATSLPWYDIQSIIEQQPNRQIDPPRAANQHTLRFGVHWMPAVDVFA